jgi:GNAT superfamily N-acetyltransferase
MVFRPIFLSALNIVRKVLAADYGCDRGEFEKEGVFIHRFARSEGARRFRIPEKPFAVVTMGRGLVISCSLERLGWADAHLSNLSRNDIFTPAITGMINEYLKADKQHLTEPDLKFICTDEIFRPYQPGKDIEIVLAEEPLKLGLTGDKRFPNSLGMVDHPDRPWKVAAAAKIKGEIVGLASASADCDPMWQIGVDTLETYRNHGIAKATVSAVTQYLIDKGITPYYSSYESNAASRATAAALGYKTAWVEMYEEDIQA